MSFTKTVFRAYDIRGIAMGNPSTDSTGLLQAGSGQVEITPEFAKALGIALVKKMGIKNPKLIVGRDNRLTGEALKNALIEGLVSQGAQVTDIDLASTPYFYFAVCDGQADAGIQITASHNPKEYNGFKVVKEMGLPFSGEEIEELGEMMNSLDEVEKVEGGKVSQKDFKEAYFARLQEINPLKRKLKVVVDCGNGIMGIFASQFLKQLGCEVIELYCELDGNFPNHPANPEDLESLEEIRKTVVETKANLGIAFDGDGDRVGVIDENGEVITPDWLMILFSRDLLSRNPGAEIIFDIKSSNVLKAEIEKLGGKAVRWKTGHSFIKRKMKDDNALLAGEVSGHVFFAENYFGVDDALLASARVMQILSQKEQKLSELFEGIPPTFTTPEIKLHIEEEKKFPILKKIVEDFSKEFPSANTLDGVRVDFEDASWGVIRASNTSPYLTTRFEALSEARLKEVIAIFIEKLKKFEELDTTPLKNKA